MVLLPEVFDADDDIITHGGIEDGRWKTEGGGTYQKQARSVDTNFVMGFRRSSVDVSKPDTSLPAIIASAPRCREWVGEYDFISEKARSLT